MAEQPCAIENDWKLKPRVAVHQTDVLPVRKPTFGKTTYGTYIVKNARHFASCQVVSLSQYVENLANLTVHGSGNERRKRQVSNQKSSKLMADLPIFMQVCLMAHTSLVTSAPSPSFIPCETVEEDFAR